LFSEGTGATELLDLAREAIPTLEAFADDRALGRAWLSVGFARGNFEGDNSALEEAAGKAADYYRRAGWSPSTSLTSLASALYYGPHPVDDAIERCEELLASHAGDVASEANILVWLGGLEGMRRRFDQGLVLVDRARSAYQQLGLALAAAETCGLVEGGILTLAGRLEAAEQALRATCEMCIAMNESAVLASRAAELADVLYDAQRYDEAETWTDISRKNSGPEDRDAESSWRSVAARLAARNGEHSRAEDLAQKALEIVEMTDAINHQAKVLLNFGEVRHLAGRHEQAVQLVQRAVDLYLRKGNVAGADVARALLATTVVAK
jgi:tetratricopeptide (TPR) repeat protein